MHGGKMKLKLITLFVVLGTLISSCGPSEKAVQMAIAQTQTAMPTAIPTATINPCTDRGWADISIYLKQFDATKPVVGTSILAFLQSLQSYQDKINNVSIDACSEQARQKIVSSLSNQIYVMQDISTGGALNEDLITLLVNSEVTLKEAIDELAVLGITIDYSFTSE
jgi:hypothetical protein